MRIQWCWRCKLDMPMLDEDEFAAIWARFHDARPQDGRQVLLDEYERLTGYRETNFNAVFHHRICIYGPPCPNCGFVLRTPIAYKCFECGHILHEPNWAFLFDIAEMVESPPGGTMLVTQAHNITGKLKIGDRVEIWDFSRRVFAGSVREIQPMTDQVGLRLSPEISRSQIFAGQRVQLAQSHCR